ncbi:MAG: hypothetical protein ACI841_005214 [Planctomycetota bacterium]|jgi:uncharacterized protein (DUF58 family)
MSSDKRGIDPAILDKLSNLSLTARQVVEGFMAGHHISPHRGSSVEFAQHRPYVPGDELRRVDWKVFARSERLVVKEYVEETNLSCNILLDASESMGFGSVGRTKLDYARWCAAALAHLVLIQRDTAGLVIFDEKHRLKVPPGNGTPQELAIMGALSQAEAGGPTSIGRALELLAPRLRHRGIVAIFSDFIDEPESIMEGIRRMVHAGHEPILFQVMDPLELSFDLDSLVRLDGLEGTGAHKIDPKAIREAYLKEMRAHNQELASGARALSVDYVLLDTSEPLDAALSTYLSRRTARSRGGRS